MIRYVIEIATKKDVAKLVFDLIEKNTKPHRKERQGRG
jgi:hypothetical protein